MRLAYIAYNKTSFKAHHVLEQHFSSIDTYLINQEDVCDYDIINMPVMVDNVLIPTNIELQTTRHKLILHDIASEFNFFKKNLLLDSGVQNEDSILLSKKSEKIQIPFQSIELVEFNKITNKYTISSNNTEKEYDYLIVESHQLLGEELMNKTHEVLSKNSQQSHLVLNLEFATKYKLHKQHLHNDFLYVVNAKVKAIFDNWYLCSLLENKLCVSLFYPYSQLKSEELIAYIVDRVRSVLNLSLDVFEIAELIKHSFGACDGFTIKDPILKHPKSSSAFPTFSYWPQNQVNNYIQNTFYLKNVKNKNLFKEKEAQ